MATSTKIGSGTQTHTGSAPDTSPDSGVPADPTRTISDARALIDALDEQIIQLVQERVDVSARIQRTRIAAGGRRVHLSREMEVLDRFRAELGRPGTALAMTLLELSRGRI